MKKIIAFFITVAISIGMTSCSQARSAREMLDELMELYPATGAVYYSDACETEEGYISEELFSRIYVYHGELPSEFAIYLNTHTDYGSECGVFVCEDEDERARVTDMCRERIDLVGRGGDHAFIARSGSVVFYSTLSDRERAEKIWNAVR